ncbi:Kelch-like protein 30 [Tetrabaena socialis]|uniref:Kelch-like protein 30 n=1 Tax=Tetrabaena socialis TaxID=47790 RepID=A0A2J8A1E4_9CHLO|nr:Kelch-like protein 30 [Tetrabaena socialis]|eukprot:PNH06346.1 Kelch-like protein 30 [Tetrabaena socialis]
MRFLRCSISVVSRLLPSVGHGEAVSTQTLVACGRELRAVTGADALSGLELGSPLQLYADPAARDGEPVAARRAYETQHGFACPVWDRHTSAAYMFEGRRVVRLSADDTVTVVAGDVEERGNADGPGTSARFCSLRCSACDGAGSLYVVDKDCIRKVQLPGGGPAAAMAAAGGGPVGGTPGGQAAGLVDEALVSNLLLRAPNEIMGLAFDSGGCSGSLLFMTNTALYRLPLGDPTAAPLLLAGAEGVEGTADGYGADARFRSIWGIVLDGEGCAYVADWEDEDTTALRRVAVGGTVTTVVAGLEGSLGLPAILPNGCLALNDFQEGSLHVLGLGLKLPGCHAAGAAPVGPPPRTLPADLAALLARQPDGTADVTIMVGERIFHAHRGLLSARSDYFQQRFGADFADGSAPQLSLPDADPDVFEVVLGWVYTDAADIPAAHAAGVAELADRLLLPELREQAVAVMEASVSAVTVAALLLWAEARGPAFAGLLSRLKAWYVDNSDAVMREAKEEMRLLAARSPDLMLELMHDICSRPTKRSPRGVVSRLLPASRPGEPAVVQTLVACSEGLRPLAGADGRSGLELGPPLQLFADPAARAWGPAAARRPYTPTKPLQYPVWDPFSSAVYMCEGHAVLRLAGDNTVTMVAGDVEEEGDTDGPGRAARFSVPWYLTADGVGSLYVAEGGASPCRLRKLLLPGVGQGASAAAVTAAAGGAAVGGSQAAAEGEVLVSSLLHAPGEVLGLAFDGGISSDAGSSSSSGSLLFTTEHALYRLPLGDPSPRPTLLAGAEGVAGTADGRGADARFFFSSGIVLDGEGCVYVTDVRCEETTSLRRVAADGAVTTVRNGLQGGLEQPAILPNGFLVFCDGIPDGPLHVFGLGLKLPRDHAAAAPLWPAAPAGPPPRTLPADLAALLARQPDGTADVAIVVGGRTFHAHRGLLCARSDYFQQRFGPDFADGSTQQLSLPDADPDAFEVVLGWVYTDAADIPAALAAGVAELADRLLLPELREQASTVLEASVSAVTVVGLLLWAEALGPTFAGLLSRLKAWYVDNHETVMHEAKEELELLAARSPDLLF